MASHKDGMQMYINPPKLSFTFQSNILMHHLTMPIYTILINYYFTPVPNATHSIKNIFPLIAYIITAKLNNPTSNFSTISVSSQEGIINSSISLCD
jgi:anaerobic C4-dicarboxylate transporter